MNEQVATVIYVYWCLEVAEKVGRKHYVLEK